MNQEKSAFLVLGHYGCHDVGSIKSVFAWHAREQQAREVYSRHLEAMRAAMQAEADLIDAAESLEWTSDYYLNLALLRFPLIELSDQKPTALSVLSFFHARGSEVKSYWDYCIETESDSEGPSSCGGLGDDWLDDELTDYFWEIEQAANQTMDIDSIVPTAASAKEIPTEHKPVIVKSTERSSKMAMNESAPEAIPRQVKKCGKCGAFPCPNYEEHFLWMRRKHAELAGTAWMLSDEFE